MPDERPSLSEGRRRQKASIPESSARWRKEVVMFKGWLYANADALLDLAEADAALSVAEYADEPDVDSVRLLRKLLITARRRFLP